LVKPKNEDIQTKGTIMDIVTGITRGETCPRGKLNELVKDVRSIMKPMQNN